MLILLAKARGSRDGTLLVVVGVLILFAFLVLGLVSAASDVATMVTGIGPVIEFLGTGLGVLVAVVVAALMVLMGVAFMIHATPQPEPGSAGSQSTTPTGADSRQTQDLERLRGQVEQLEANKDALNKELASRDDAGKNWGGTITQEDSSAVIERLRAEKAALQKELEKVRSAADTPTIPEPVSASSNPTIGETVSLESGAKITVHSYEAPVPLLWWLQQLKPEDQRLKPDHELSAIDVEAYAGSNPEN